MIINLEYTLFGFEWHLTNQNEKEKKGTFPSLCGMSKEENEAWPFFFMYTSLHSTHYHNATSHALLHLQLGN